LHVNPAGKTYTKFVPIGLCIYRHLLVFSNVFVYNLVMNTEQEFEEFAKKYPDLMSKSRQDYIGVGKGWHHILDVLFQKFSVRLETARSTLKYALENPDKKLTRSIEELENSVKRAEEELPVILQIKEKFGGLRIYTNGVNIEYDSYVEFAEAMSYQTCEVCGAPGKIRHSGWHKTLCDDHNRKREEGEDIFVIDIED